MKQQSLASQAVFEKYGRKSRRELFLEEMEGVVPWSALESLVRPHYAKAGNGRQPVGLSIMLSNSGSTQTQPNHPFFNAGSLSSTNQTLRRRSLKRLEQDRLSNQQEAAASLQKAQDAYDAIEDQLSALMKTLRTAQEVGNK